MRREHQITTLISGIIIASLGCMFTPGDAGYGAECEEDDDCGRDVFRDCKGGYCGGQNCKNRDCPDGFVCSEPSTLLGYNLSTPTCEKVCQSNDDCPNTWQCEDERCAFLSRSVGAMRLENPDVPRGGMREATLELYAVAGEAREVKWYIAPLDPGATSPPEKSLVNETGKTLTNVYTFEEAGLFTLSASFEDYNGVTETTQNVIVTVCLLEGDTCGEQQTASCCEGDCQIPDGQSEGTCTSL